MILQSKPFSFFQRQDELGKKRFSFETHELKKNPVGLEWPGT